MNYNNFHFKLNIREIRTRDRWFDIKRKLIILLENSLNSVIYKLKMIKKD